MISSPLLRSSVACLLMFVSSPQATVAQNVRAIGPEARAYLDHVLDILETESLNRAMLDWPQLRASAHELAAGAESPEETYRAIIHVVGNLGEEHSRFIPPMSYVARMAQVPEDAFRAAVERPGAEPSARRIHQRLGLVQVPAFSGPDPDGFATRIAERIRDVSSDEICGWVVDVRGNTGGNMWPMLQGLFPLLGEGVPGYFVYPDGTWSEWSVEADAWHGYEPRSDVAVAVLHDEETASSGEAVVVAFRGRPQTRTFGRPTAGLSTANRTIDLPDGARLLLAVAVYADRDRQQYGGVILPDVELDVEMPEDEVISRVRDWLLGQRSCTDGGK